MANQTAEIIIDEHGRVLNDPTHAEPVSQGNSAAAWTLVLFVLVGCTLTGIGMLMGSMATIYTGVGVVVVGLIVGFIMRSAGYGVYGKHTQAKAEQKA